MKSLLLTALLAGAVAGLFAQHDSLSFHALSGRILAIEHNVPNEEVDDASVTYGIELAYRRQLNQYLSLGLPLKVGIIDVNAFENPIFVALDLTAQVWPLGTGGGVSPFLQAGIGYSFEEEERSNRQIPLGAGLDFKLGNRSWLGVRGEYRMSSGVPRNNVQLAVGYTYRLRQAARFEPPVAAVIADRDNDGTPDDLDQCPDLAGPVRLVGCPDSDNDGIVDPKDDCPDQAAPTSDGCPITDRDGDGFDDVEDECPYIRGPIRGCPEPPPPPSAPEPEPEPEPQPAPTVVTPESPAPPFTAPRAQARLDYAAQAVEFEAGSDELENGSYATLAEIAILLQLNPDHTLVIAGHTDDRGTDQFNLELSRKRAESCQSFLVGAGLSAQRIVATGFGKNQPIADNATAEGRALNRRVEFELRPE